MMQLNRKVSMPVLRTYEGAKAALHVSPEQQLRRTVLSCLLFENEFYEDGVTIADRIMEYTKIVPIKALAELAIEARSKHNLRHVPLLMLSILADASKGTSLVSDTITNVIQRADELAELLVIHATRHNTTPDKLKSIMTHGMRRGLAKAFCKFSSYSLARYNRDNAVKLRDVLFLSHAKPKDEEQKKTWEALIAGTLESPDTWEVQLSAGKNKKETFERLIKEDKLGYLALLRNLRNMVQAGCDEDLVREAILAKKGGADRVLPFRFIGAARHAPQFEPELDKALIQTIHSLPKLEGTTVVLVDVSGSMDARLSQRSDLTRADAAAALASIINGNRRVFSFSSKLVEVPPRLGMAGIDAVLKSQSHSSTELFKAVEEVNGLVKYDRIIVITDEQAGAGNGDRMPAPLKNGYLINVASARNGVGYGKWVHLDGFSENIIRFIYEKEQNKQ